MNWSRSSVRTGRVLFPTDVALTPRLLSDVGDDREGGRCEGRVGNAECRRGINEKENRRGLSERTSSPIQATVNATKPLARCPMSRHKPLELLNELFLILTNCCVQSAPATAVAPFPGSSHPRSRVAPSVFKIRSLLFPTQINTSLFPPPSFLFLLPSPSLATSQQKRKKDNEDATTSVAQRHRASHVSVQTYSLPMPRLSFVRSDVPRARCYQPVQEVRIALFQGRLFYLFSVSSDFSVLSCVM